MHRSEQSRKQPYHPPKLRVYGDIAQITQFGPGKDADAGGGPGVDKTG